MDWRKLVRELAQKSVIELLAIPALAAVLYGLARFIPPLNEYWQTPIWLLAWVGIIIVMLAVVFARFATQRARYVLRIHTAPMAAFPDEGGEAYILLKVDPNESEAIAQSLSESELVDYAAAVWGDWDIVLRVKTGNSRTLVSFIRDLQRLESIHRTETYVVRRDQPETHLDGITGEHWAFLLLRVPARKTDEVLKQLRLMADERHWAKIAHAAGILGKYDIAVTVRYSNDEELVNLVMRYIQYRLQAESLTMPTIRNMVFRRGRSA